MAKKIEKGLPCPIGSVEASNELARELFLAIKKGDKKKIRKAITEKGIDVEERNIDSQSALLYACIQNKIPAVQLLLEFGANPNSRADGGYTPVHVACYHGNISLLVKLLEAGGDLRFHDDNDLTPKDWAERQEFYKKRGDMLEFLEKTRYFAMSNSGKDYLTAKLSLTTRPDISKSLVKVLKERITGSHGSLDGVQNSLLGFGKVYCDTEMLPGMVSLTPLVPETSLQHDESSLTYNNGVFMVMESMFWETTDVTIKRLHKIPIAGGETELLVHECEHISKLRHPGVLLLMGVCQTNNLDGVILIFERIEFGSLYYILHITQHKFQIEDIHSIVLQVCRALIFISQQNFSHCSLSSHAIQIVGENTVKIGNFEYITPLSMGRRSAAYQNKHKNALYNWLAPEIMNNEYPESGTDVYGLSVIIWELFRGDVPWKNKSAEDIKSQLTAGNSVILKDLSFVPEYYRGLLSLGLQLKIEDRKANLKDIFNHYLNLNIRDSGNRKDNHSINNSTVDINKSQKAESSKSDIQSSESGSSRQHHSSSHVIKADSSISNKSQRDDNKKDLSSHDQMSNQKEPLAAGVYTLLSGLRDSPVCNFLTKTHNDSTYCGDTVDSNVADSKSFDSTTRSQRPFSYLELQSGPTCLRPASHINKPYDRKPEKSNGTIFDLYNRCCNSPNNDASDNKFFKDKDNWNVSRTRLCSRYGSVMKMVSQLEKGAPRTAYKEEMEDDQTSLSSAEDEEKNVDEDSDVSKIIDSNRSINKSKRFSTAVYNHANSSAELMDSITGTKLINMSSDGQTDCYPIVAARSDENVVNRASSTHLRQSFSSLTDVHSMKSFDSPEGHLQPLSVHASSAHTCLPQLARTGSPCLDSVSALRTNPDTCQSTPKDETCGQETKSLAAFIKSNHIESPLKSTNNSWKDDRIENKSENLPKSYPLGREEIIETVTFPDKHIVTRKTRDLSTGDVVTLSRQEVYAEEVIAKLTTKDSNAPLSE